MERWTDEIDCVSLNFVLHKTFFRYSFDRIKRENSLPRI